MYNFTILERMVLESINKGDKTSTEIGKDTGLAANVCANVIYSLLAKSLITSEKGVFGINKNLSKGILEELRNKQNLAVEINALVRECVKKSVIDSGDTFKFKKVYMNESDKKLLKAMLYNLETFLEGLKGQKGSTKEETFIFWGGENYAQAVNRYIS